MTLPLVEGAEHADLCMFMGDFLGKMDHNPHHIQRGLWHKGEQPVAHTRLQASGLVGSEEGLNLHSKMWEYVTSGKWLAS